MTIGMDNILVPNAKCPVREVGSGLVVMAAEGTATHSLDEIGTFIWRRLDGRHSVLDVVEALVAEYEVDQAQATADVQAFMEQLIEAHLVQTA